MQLIQYPGNDCRNCHRCIRECQLNAISFVSGKANIIESQCIYCGRCINDCPQHAMHVEDPVPNLFARLAKEEVIAIIAPSFIANFPNLNFESLRANFKAWGFFEVVEAALGANIVKQAYEKQISETQPDVLISSSCHSVNLLIEKYYPDLIPLLSPTLTPVQAIAKYVKLTFPSATLAFFGPCYAKKDEKNTIENMVDVYATFSELEAYLQATARSFQINNQQIDGYLSREFQSSGGIIKTMKQEADYTYLSVDGVEECIQILEELSTKQPKKLFIEMNICEGGCIQGPGMSKRHHDYLESKIILDQYAKANARYDFDFHSHLDVSKTFFDKSQPQAMPSQLELNAILNQMGKFARKDELNCGACGYLSCRDKAIAVFQNRADVHMCLPYMKEHALSISSQVLKTSPNAIIAIGMDMRITVFNPQAYALFNLDPSNSMLGHTLDELLPLDSFICVLTMGELHEVYYHEGLGKYIDKSVKYDEDVGMVLLLLKDITQTYEQNKKRQARKQESFALTDEIVRKQMRIVQEIASLLGETTAETKVAISKFKHLLEEEWDDEPPMD
ncbi:MAG: [Fe-Fe] hydrogenase large subunit C-terminal domain-containing protein [Erysipelotrichaceae bacterium]